MTACSPLAATGEPAIDLSFWRLSLLVQHKVCLLTFSPRLPFYVLCEYFVFFTIFCILLDQFIRSDLMMSLFCFSVVRSMCARLWAIKPKCCVFGFENLQPLGRVVEPGNEENVPQLSNL